MSTIRIAGQDFEVVRVDSTPLDDLNTRNIGAFNARQSRITIDSAIPEHRQRKTLLHELVHAVDWAFGQHDLTEEQVVTLENGLWAVFNDNPGLARGIFGDNA